MDLRYNLGDKRPPKKRSETSGLCVQQFLGYVTGHPAKDGQSIRGSLGPNLCAKPFVDDKTTRHIPVLSG